MERQPIVTEAAAIAIQMVKEPVTIKNLLPTYFYKFQSMEVPPEATSMYEGLVEFFGTNEELAIPDKSVVSEESYIKGFQKAMALTRLWIDSIYLTGEDGTPFGDIK